MISLLWLLGALATIGLVTWYLHLLPEPEEDE